MSHSKNLRSASDSGQIVQGSDLLQPQKVRIRSRIELEALLDRPSTLIQPVDVEIDTSREVDGRCNDEVITEIKR